MKVKLYTLESGWDSLHAKICDHVGIPTATTKRYADKEQVKASHEDGGKYIMPILADGKWKCDDIVSGTVDFNPDWLDAS